MTENADDALITEKNEIQERMPPKLKADPIDSTDPTDPIDRIDPAEPIDRIDPVDPIESNDPERAAPDEWGPGRDVDAKRRDRGMPPS